MAQDLNTQMMFQNAEKATAARADQNLAPRGGRMIPPKQQPYGAPPRSLAGFPVSGNPNSSVLNQAAMQGEQAQANAASASPAHSNAAGQQSALNQVAQAGMQSQNRQAPAGGNAFKGAQNVPMAAIQRQLGI